MSGHVDTRHPTRELPPGRGPHLPEPAATAVATLAEWLPELRSFWQLTKPKVVGAIVFTAVIGMFLATPAVPPLRVVLFASAGIWLAAASAAAFNHLLDRRYDALMARTRQRPLPRGRISEAATLAFAAVLGIVSMAVLIGEVNRLTAVLTLASLIGYSVVYTVWLKHATPHNIVIGGAAGAAPPLLGWVAVTGHAEANALLASLIVFTWTPPHFWALAIARRDDYAKAGIPMLPVTHGVAFTATFALLYTALLAAVVVLPYLTGMSGIVYLAGALALTGVFGRYALELKRMPDAAHGMRMFRYSINYLLLLFALLLVDHYIHGR